MLQDMCYPRVIRGGRAEPDGKYLIVIIIGQVQQPRPAAFMVHKVRHRIHFFDIFLLNHAKAIVQFSSFQSLRSSYKILSLSLY